MPLFIRGIPAIRGSIPIGCGWPMVSRSWGPPCQSGDWNVCWMVIGSFWFYIEKLMKRRILYAFLLTLLAVNLALGARIYFYSAQAAAATNDNPYDSYKLLADVMEKVRLEYVDGDKVSYPDLVHAALKGILGSLDPHSEYMDARRFQDLQNDTEGEFGGIGIMV